MKYQALFSSKDKSKNLKCCLLQFLFGSLGLRVLSNTPTMYCQTSKNSLCNYECIAKGCEASWYCKII